MLKNMLQLFVIVLWADGFHFGDGTTIGGDSGARHLRRHSVLQQMLTVEDPPDLSVRWPNVLSGEEKCNVAARFVHRGVCGQRLCPAEEERLY